MAATFRSFNEKLGDSPVQLFVGNQGELFWDPESSTLRVSDGETSGGVVITSGAGAATVFSADIQLSNGGGTAMYDIANVKDTGTIQTEIDITSFQTQEDANKFFGAAISTLSNAATPTIGDATLTLKSSDGTTVGTFTANATVDKNITLPQQFSGSYTDLTDKPTIPTNNNQLANGAGYITAADVTVPTNNNELTNGAGYITISDVPTNNNELTNGAGYITAADVTVPTNNNELSNGAGYITAAALPTNVSELANDSGFITSAAVPTNNNQLTNGAGYITADDLDGLDGALTFKGKIDATTEYPGSVATGDVYCNTGTGNAEAQWGLTTVAPSDLIGRAETEWVIIGSDNVPDLTGYVKNGDNISLLTNDKNYVTASAVPTDNTQLSNGRNFITISSVPTNNNQLDNGRNFITIADVPTKLSQLTNDSDFARNSDIPTNNNELANGAGYITSAALPTNVSDLANDSNFVTAAAIPTDNTELANGRNFITAAALPTDVGDLTNDAGYITIGDVPTNNNQLTNGAGFITSSALPTDVGDLTNNPGFTTNAYVDAGDNALQSQINAINADYTTADEFSTQVLRINANEAAVATIPTNNNQLTNGAGFITADELAGLDQALTWKGPIDATSTYPGSVAAGDVYSNNTDGTAEANYVGLTDVTEGDIIAYADNGTWSIIGHVDIPDLGIYVEVGDNVSALINDAQYQNATQVAAALPTKVSQLENDTGFVTAVEANMAAPVKSVNGKTGALNLYAADISGFQTVATSGKFDDLVQKPTIPTNNAQLVNGAGYITASQVPAQGTVINWAALPNLTL